MVDHMLVKQPREYKTITATLTVKEVLDSKKHSV